MLGAKRSNRRRGAEAARRRWRLPAWKWRPLLVGLLVLGLIGAVYAALMPLFDQPIERIVVTGRLQRVSAFDIEKSVRAQLHGAGLISVNLGAISRALQSLAWVDRATVQRSWPRGLSVEVTEQEAIARWNRSGLLNARGEVFLRDAHDGLPELPQLSGPEGAQAEVATRYLACQGRLVEAGLRMVALSVDERGAWNMTLDNGIGIRLGREQMDERFERFVSVAARLVSQRAADISYVDMRYSNGFAVGWKAGLHPSPSAASSPADAGRA